MLYIALEITSKFSGKMKGRFVPKLSHPLKVKDKGPVVDTILKFRYLDFGSKCEYLYYY